MKADTQFERYRPHPWHGVDAGENAPKVVNVYVEITPFDQMKYELDPRYGFLRVDRPQRSASLPPALYGLIPQTLCGDRVARFCDGKAHGDGDALDICVLSEHDIRNTEILLSARVVGGIRTIDRDKDDEKIVAVLENDLVWGEVDDIETVPGFMVERLLHYFASYKQEPGRPRQVDVLGTYGAAEAHQVVEAAMRDYWECFR